MFDVLEDLLKQAKSYGATDADVVLSDTSSVSVGRRFGKPESTRRAEEADIGLRVFVGKKSAIVSSSDRSADALKAMAERAVAMAKCVPDDAFAGIADPAEIAKNFPDLDLCDESDVPMEKMIEYADRAEDAARSIKGITNSEGAEFSCGRDHSYYLATNGFAGSYKSSGFSLSVSIIAGSDLAMEVDYDYDSASHFSDLAAPEEIGKNAGNRAVAAQNPRKVSTCQVPVIYDPRVSGGLIGSLAGAISGAAVARGTTLLKESMGKKVFSTDITIVDDPFMKRGHRSHPFDGEGVMPQKRNIIENGVLQGWFLDLASARQLGLKSTGSAMRGSGGPPSPRASNFYMKPGKISAEELISGVKHGFLVTSFLGGGGNTLTGDYSRGAKGFWIENGKIAYPVSEVTVAGNLRDMWLNLIPANDLRFKFGVDAPTILLEGMTVAGA